MSQHFKTNCNKVPKTNFNEFNIVHANNHDVGTFENVCNGVLRKIFVNVFYDFKKKLYISYPELETKQVRVT